MERAPDRDDDVETIRGDDPPGDTSGGPLGSGAGEGSGQDAPDAPDVNVPGGAHDSDDAPGRG